MGWVRWTAGGRGGHGQGQPGGRVINQSSPANGELREQVLNQVQQRSQLPRVETVSPCSSLVDVDPQATIVESNLSATSDVVHVVHP